MFHASSKSSSRLNVLVLRVWVPEGKHIRNWLHNEMESLLKKGNIFTVWEQIFNCLRFKISRKKARFINGCWNLLSLFLQNYRTLFFYTFWRNHIRRMFFLIKYHLLKKKWWVLWYFKHWRLFNARSCVLQFFNTRSLFNAKINLYMYIEYIGFDLTRFYSI